MAEFQDRILFYIRDVSSGIQQGILFIPTFEIHMPGRFVPPARPVVGTGEVLN